MTEVPEHLLKRSRDRRAALGLGGDGGEAAPGVESPAASSPATTSAAPVAAAAAPVVEAAPKPPPFVPPYVLASLNRKRIPVWTMPVLFFLPLWGVLYAQSLSAPPVTAVTQLAAGATVYSPCSSCHGGGGGGGVGRQLSEGQVLLTFPNIASQLEYVRLGDDGHEATYGTNKFGDPQRSGGQHQSPYNGVKMPAFAKLSDTELLEVVRHERETLAGEKSIKVDGAGKRLWPDGKPMLDAAGKLVWPDGTPMFSADGKLTPNAANDVAKPPAG